MKAALEWITLGMIGSAIGLAFGAAILSYPTLMTIAALLIGIGISLGLVSARRY